MESKPGRRFTNWIESYLEYTDDTEAPGNFHLWTALVTLAGAVQRKVWIDLGHFQWVPNLYVMLVGEPGIVTKSTSIRIGSNLLRGVKGYTRGPDSVTWQALLDSFSEAMHSFKFDGGELVQAPLTLFVAEMGNFLDPSNRESMDLLTDMWDGQATTFTRRTRGSGESTLQSPWLNFIACTTPTWIQNNFSSDLVGGGFASRLIVVYGEKKKRLIAYPGISSGGLKSEMEAALISDLQHIARLVGPMTISREPESLVLRNSDGVEEEKHYPGGALQWGEEWYAQLQAGLGKEIISRRASGYYARKQTHLHKIAMLIALSQRDDLILKLEDLKAANDVLVYVERDIMRVLSNVTNRQLAAKNMMEVMALLKSGQKITEGDLYSHLWSFMSKKDLDDALSNLQAAKKIQTYAMGGKAYLRLTK